MKNPAQDLAQFLNTCTSTKPLAEALEGMDLKKQPAEFFMELFVKAVIELQGKQKEMDMFMAGADETIIDNWLDEVERHARMLRALKERTPQQQFDLDTYDEAYANGIYPTGFDANDNFEWDEFEIVPFKTAQTI